MFPEYDEEYYDPSVMDEILEEFQEKCRAAFIADANSKLGAIKCANDQLEKENGVLRTILAEAQRNLAKSESIRSKLTMIQAVMDGLKSRVGEKKEGRDNNILNFLDTVFDADYCAEEYDAPLWIVALTRFYSHKDIVIQILRFFDVRLPDNIDNFRLPVDWNEDELDIFFSHMSSHSNTNEHTYDNNLGYWGSRSLMDVKSQCGCGYTQIPWQFILRNPLLKQEKYLSQIGKNAFNRGEYWHKCFAIDRYLNLSPDEINMIASGIDETRLKKSGVITEFLVRNLKHIEDERILDKVYELCQNNWNFNRTVAQMPFSYSMRYARDHSETVVEFINLNKKEFTEDQKKQLLAGAFGL